MVLVKEEFEGKIASIKFARENNIPFFGICLGMQLAVIEIAKNLLKIKNANSTEFFETSNPVVGLMTEWQKDNIKVSRNEYSDKGGTMRLRLISMHLIKILRLIKFIKLRKNS